MEIQTFQLGILGTNGYLLEEGKQALVIDPGGDAKILIDHLEKHELDLQAILLTHAHFDHIGGVEELRQHTQAPVYLHENESEWLTEPRLNGSEFFQVGSISAKKPADHAIEPGNLSIGHFHFEISHTPGHSPGSVSFWFDQEEVLFAGDTLFKEGIGRTDLPFADHDTLITSIKDRIFTYPDSTIVYPGHGPATTVGEEKNSNPFLIG